jgi:hypothetical protein
MNSSSETPYPSWTPSSSPYYSWTPSPYPYPSWSPSSAPYSFTATPGPTASPYTPRPSHSPSSLPLPVLYNKQKILSDVSDDAFYGIMCAVVFVTVFTCIHLAYYYRKFKKERLRLKRLNELQGKVYSSVNPAYPR